MKYVFEKEELSCVELEEQLGLSRGEIKEIVVSPEGAVQVETVSELTSTNLEKLTETLKGYNLPRGKKR